MDRVQWLVKLVAEERLCWLPYCCATAGSLTVIRQIFMTVSTLSAQYAPRLLEGASARALARPMFVVINR